MVPNGRDLHEDRVCSGVQRDICANRTCHRIRDLATDNVVVLAFSLKSELERESILSNQTPEVSVIELEVRQYLPPGKIGYLTYLGQDDNYWAPLCKSDRKLGTMVICSPWNIDASPLLCYSPLRSE